MEQTGLGFFDPLRAVRMAVVKIAIQQAQIGAVVAELLSSAEELTAEKRRELNGKVEQSVKDLLDITEQLLDADGH